MTVSPKEQPLLRVFANALPQGPCVTPAPVCPDRWLPWGAAPRACGRWAGPVGSTRRLPGTYLVRAGCLVHAARVFVLLLGLGLVGHTVGLVHGSHVVAEGDGLHGFVHAAAHGPPDFGGERGALLSGWVLGLLREGESNRKVKRGTRGLESVGGKPRGGTASLT